MERLTLDNAIKYIKEVARKNRINKEKNTIILPNSFISSNDCADKYGQVAKWLEELKSYKDLEEQGLLVRLPCKVGDILFRINKGARNPIIKMKVSHITIKSKSYSIKAIEEDYGEVLFSNNVIGKTVFLTREDAEKKLEEMIK